MIKYEIGDATNPVGDGPKILPHCVNDIGLWGSGYVVALSRRWPQPETQYRYWFTTTKQSYSSFRLGETQFVQVGSKPDVVVANMIAQHGIKSRTNPKPVQYDALRKCLERVAIEALELRASIHMPRICSDRAGGSWSEVEPIIRESLCGKGISVFVYDLPSETK